MGSSLWFLKLALKCIDHLAWPLLALGYPLCASVQAIETDSYTETRVMISYWILLSLIYLFEYAFLWLLQRFQFWPYIKLMIVFWLIMPDFGRASYVYNNLIRSCISVKPQAVISRLKNWRKLFVKKESFLLQAERYIKENGTEALEKLIASKNVMHDPYAEATNAIRATDKKETQQEEHLVQTNGKRLQTEHRDIKDLEVIEKNEIPAGNQDIPIVPNLAATQNASSAMVEAEGMVGKNTAGGELPQSSTHKEVQKEWTCAVYPVTTTSEKNLNSHLLGRKHQATCEALKAKNQPVPQKLKNDQSKEELKQKNIINQYANIEQKNIQISHAKEYAQTSKENKITYVCEGVPAPANKTDQLNSKTNNEEGVVNNGLKGKVVIDHEKVQVLQKNLSQPVGMKPSILRCEVCNVSCTSEGDMASHLNGMRHLANANLSLQFGSLPAISTPVGSETQTGANVGVERSVGW